MLDTTLLQGELVRLVASNPEKIGPALARWRRDSEYWRLLADDPCYPYSPQKVREWVEKTTDEAVGKNTVENYMFAIETLEDGRLIGEIGLDGIQWAHGDAFVGIGIGERDFWGRGYGTDAMRVILRYAFTELNLQRVSLDVFEYNPRAFHSYEKVGFVVEGRARGALCREGRRWDLIYMGILRAEWQKLYATRT